MKIFHFLFIVCCLVGSGCGLRQREDALAKRENEINQKEQRLLLLEKELQLKAQELAQQQSVDTSDLQYGSNDSAVINRQIIGNWAVTMRCTATNCEGSAVGDTKNEVWEIYYVNQNVIIQAKVDNQLVRTYTGAFKDNNLVLTAQQDETSPQTKMMVRLTMKSNTEMEGVREITRENNCQIVYALNLRKQ